MTVNQAAEQEGSVSSGVSALAVVSWLAVLLPVATIVQIYYMSAYFAKLNSKVIAGIAFLTIAMVTLSLWAAIGLWQRRAGSVQTAEYALLAAMAANMLGFAPLSILMSAPPLFLPVVIVTMACLSVVDRWR